VESANQSHLKFDQTRKQTRAERQGVVCEATRRFDLLRFRLVRQNYPFQYNNDLVDNMMQCQMQVSIIGFCSFCRFCCYL